MKLFSRVRSDRRGAAVAEYGLIAAVAGVAHRGGLARARLGDDERLAAPATACARQRC